ncbi:hypothetical protein NDU88_006885 [Pleurodeles waltl]|uniref:Uncharacterized protein n=1 Tax=Pleurodeles waltl TaxID=8319 RepID=A0AAV7LY81_PLEWA|nr:hypothetical protein NDU88_006885 [Pleurodeles waltl]
MFVSPRGSMEGNHGNPQNTMSLMALVYRASFISLVSRRFLETSSLLAVRCSAQRAYWKKEARWITGKANRPHSQGPEAPLTSVWHPRGRKR